MKTRKTKTAKISMLQISQPLYSCLYFSVQDHNSTCQADYGKTIRYEQQNFFAAKIGDKPADQADIRHHGNPQP